MKLKVGDKIRAFLKRNGKGVEITTVIAQICDSGDLRVEWEDGHNGFWWISGDHQLAIEHCDGWGKIICKNWKRFERANSPGNECEPSD